MRGAEHEADAAEHQHVVAVRRLTHPAVHLDLAEAGGRKLADVRQHESDDQNGLHPVQDQHLERVPSPPPHARERQQVGGEREDTVENHGNPCRAHSGIERAVSQAWIDARRQLM